MGNISKYCKNNSIAEFEETYKKEITEFPSIFLIKDDQFIEFNAKPSESNLEKFLNDVLWIC